MPSRARCRFLGRQRLHPQETVRANLSAHGPVDRLPDSLLKRLALEERNRDFCLTTRIPPSIFFQTHIYLQSQNNKQSKVSNQLPGQSTVDQASALDLDPGTGFPFHLASLRQL